MLVSSRRQEASDREEGEEADGEEEDFDIPGDDTSDDSDSEELEEKGEMSFRANHWAQLLFLEVGRSGSNDAEEASWI